MLNKKLVLAPEGVEQSGYIASKKFLEYHDSFELKFSLEIENHKNRESGNGAFNLYLLPSKEDEISFIEYGKGLHP